MTVAHLYACDHPVAAPTAQYATAYSTAHPCPATSRPAATETVMRLVAARDGWQVAQDGTHLCPAHARTAVNA